MRLTDSGRELAEALSDGFERIADGVRRIMDRTTLRPVTVSLTPSFAEVWLMPRIGQFWAAHPDIEIRLVPTISLSDLRRDGIDVAIRFGSGDWPGMDVEPLEVSRFVVIASPDYTKVKSLEELGKLSAHDWYFSAASREQKVWGRAIGIDFEKLGAQNIANNGLVVSAVRAGLGLSLQSRTLVAPDLASGQLVTLYEGDPEGLGYYIVTRPGVMTSGAKIFMSWLRKTAKAQRQV
jgi:LysR family glycine cleavage system transcriptional activator